MPVQIINLEQWTPLLPGETYAVASGRKRGRNGGTSRDSGKDRSLRPNGPRRVLIFGRLFELALYRAEVLRSRGFSVLTPKTKAEAIAAIDSGEFDALILSYTLSTDTAEELIELARQRCPDCPLITISDSVAVDRKLRPDVVVPAAGGPAALIRALQRVFRTQ